jgi:hypothetical protein
MDGAEMARVSEFVRNGETRASEQRGAIAQGCRGAFERGYRQNMGQSHAQPSKRARARALSLPMRRRAMTTRTELEPSVWSRGKAGWHWHPPGRERAWKSRRWSLI